MLGVSTRCACRKRYLPEARQLVSLSTCNRPELHFTGNYLLRAAEQRSNAEAISALRRSRGALYAVFSDRLDPLVTLVDNGQRKQCQTAWLSFEQASALPGCDVDAGVLLGIEPDSGAPRLAVVSYGADGKGDQYHGGHFEDARKALFALPRNEAAQLGQARTILHWIGVSQYCPLCSSPTQQANAGWKRRCSNPTCASRKEVSNFNFPRSDPTAITLVLDKTKTRCLLGRQKRFPPQVYSCLAGFVEPGESIEEAARREVLEESGVDIGMTARYMFSQPWPFPASLMLGMIATAQTMDIILDDELEDARWWDIAEVREAIGRKHSQTPSSSGTLLLPPKVAIANQLIRSWALADP